MNSPLLLLFCALTGAIRVPVSYDDTPSSCPGSSPSKAVLCYYDGELSLKKLNPCLCTHVVLTSAASIHPTNYTLNITSDVGKVTHEMRMRNPELYVLLRVGGSNMSTETAEALVKSADRRAVFSASVARIVKEADINGIEITFPLDAKGGSKHSKGGLVALAKLLRKEMGVEKSHRSRRDYSVFELIDDVSTTAWTPTNFKPFGVNRDVRRADTGIRTPHRTSLRSARTDTDDYARDLLRQTYLALEHKTPKNRLIMVNVPITPEVLVKRYDLKTLSKYVDYFILPSHNLTDSSENGVTYHPSRLMGLADILNTDSLLDLMTGLGAPHDKLIISIPATATKFTLKDPQQNTPRSPVTSEPTTISQTQLCALMSEGGWTVERDEDLTAPYAFKNDTWLAFDDRISIGIKSKYVILRDLAGAALYTVDSADWSGSCLEDNTTDSKAPRLLHSLHHAFTSLARKSRGAVLETLEEDIRTSTLLTFSGDVQLSPYRIVRVVDNLGAVHVVRKDARTEFECSRQGYFRHPLGCNRFYRCVKFNQYSSDFTVFEYDCPAGLAFDERWEVCVWPGSLPEGACHGSSEIAPVPRARFACPAVEGYYADPENCRWFFACLDHARDGATPLTAYEFRCPFGLVFDEKNLLCQWPWLVEGCGNSGIYTGAFFGAVGYESGARRGYVAGAGGATLVQHGAGFVAGQGSAYSAGQGTAYSAGQGSAYSGGQISGYSAGQGSGYSAGQGSAYSAGQGSGYSAGQGSAYFAGQGSGYSARQGSAYSAGQGSAYSAGQGSAYSAGHGSGYSAGHGSGYSAGQGSAYSAVQGSAYSAGQGSAYSAGQDSGFATIHGQSSSGVLLTDVNAGENIVTATGYAGESGRSDSKYSGAQEGTFGAQIASSYISGGSSQRYGNSGEGRHIASYASFPDSLVSGGRIENAGGVVLEQNLAGVHGVGSTYQSESGEAAFVAGGQGSGHAAGRTSYSSNVAHGGVISSVPVANANEGAHFTADIVSPAPVASYERTAHGNTGSQYSGAAVSSVPVQTASYGNAAGHFSGGLVSSAPVQAAVPVATYEKTIHSNTGSQYPGGVLSSVPVQSAVPITSYQQTVVQPVAQQTYVEAPQAPVVTTYRKPAVASVPVQSAVPVTSYQQTVVQPVAQQTYVKAPQAPVVTTYRKPAVASVPVQSAVPITSYQQTVVQPVAQQTYVEAPRAPVVTTYRKPAVASVPVQSAVPVTSYQQTVVQPVAQQTYVEAPRAPVVATYRKSEVTPVTPIVSQVPIVDASPSVIPTTFRRTKLRPVAYQAPTVSTYTVSTPAPQGEYAGVRAGYARPAVSVASDGAAGFVSQSNVAVPVTPVTGGYSYSTPAVPVSTGFASSTGYSSTSDGFVSSTPSPAVVTNGVQYSTGGYVSSTPAPAVVPVSTGYSNTGFVSSTQSQAVVNGYSTGGYVSSTPAPAVVTGYSSGGYVSSPAPVVKSSTPVTAVFTGGVSFTPAPVVRTRVTASRPSYSTPSPTVKAYSLPPGGNAPILRAGLAPAEGYSYEKPAVPFITGKEATFRKVSFSSGIEPAVNSRFPGLGVGLEIPSAVPSPAYVEEGVSIQSNGARVVPTSNIEIADVRGNGYVAVTTETPVTQVYSRGQQAVPVEVYGTRNSYQGGQFLSAFPGAVPNDGFVSQYNGTAQAYLPPATVYTSAVPVVKARGRAKPFSSRISGYVSSTPIPEVSSPEVVYSSTPRPTTYRPVTRRPITYTVSTQAPEYLPPEPVAVVRTSTAGYETLDQYGQRIGASGRKSSSRTRINYDNANVEALLDKYSGKFAGLLDDNKEGFIGGVISDDLAGRGRGRVSQGAVYQRGRGESGYSTTAGYSEGEFGARTGGYSTTTAASTTENSRRRGGYSTTATPEYSTVGGDLRGKVRFGDTVNIDADGGIGYEAVTVGSVKTKSKSKENPVVVITRLSDVNPLLLAKLGVQCTCKSNTVTLKRPDGYPRGGPSDEDSDSVEVTPRTGTFGAPEHIPDAPLPGSSLVTGSSPGFSLGPSDGISSTTPLVTLEPSSTPKSAVFLKAVSLDDLGVTPVPTVLVTSLRPRGRPTVTYTTAQPFVDISSPTPFVRSRARPQVVSTSAIPLIDISSPRSRSRPIVVSSTAVPVAVADAGYARAGPRAGEASVPRASLRGDAAASRAGIGAGRSFDRYGPGGWRGVDETLQGSVDCQRAGLFRHPKYCNKFYACHWDEWKGRFTLHVFNCPVHLAYDSSLGACNWPSKGPACQDDNLLV